MTQEEFIMRCMTSSDGEVNENIKADINAMHRDGATQLIIAVMMNRADLVEELIGLGEDVNVKSGSGHNALAYAAMKEAKSMKGGITVSSCNPEIITLLVRAGADYSEAMMVAINTGCDSFAKTAIEAGIDVNITDEENRSFVMYSVMSGGGILRTLLEGGADPDVPDKKGRTPLMIAAIDDEADPQVMDTLLEFGADVNKPDRKGITPLMWAVINADKTPDPVMPALIRTGGLRAEGWQTWCALLVLHSAAKRELQLDTVRRLIREGADVNAVDKRGMNAMMYALMNGDDEAADILAEAGAAINFDMT